MTLIDILAQVSSTPTAGGIPGVGKIQTLINAVQWFALVACLIAIFGGVIAWLGGSRSGHGGAVSGGRIAVAGGALGAFLVGLGPAIINFFFSMGTSG